MGLRDIESTLPPGFRFYPSDEELVCHYLYKKVNNERASEGTMVEVDLHTREPWELPDVAKLSANEWYFFSFRDRKYATGMRTNRATKSGYWKATGKDRTIHDARTQAMVGMRKTLVFYRGRAPNGIKSSWVMHEFRLETPHSPPKEDWVLCRVFHKRKGENTGDQEHAGSSSPTLRSSPSLVDLPMADVVSSSHEQLVMSSPSSVSAAALLQQEEYYYSGGSGSTGPLMNMQALLQCNLLDFPFMQEMETTMSSSSPSLMDLGFEHGVGDHAGLMPRYNYNELPGWQ
ncbi:hypothetical protein Cni_G18384 [Canna indica]|uniref:NAC domain-containing protein n=1 Tax=Canna indica TaxID=4628 RepID=A0AAQ3QHI1_9LILI|nr:hypothetical protein Cni_G18384 [Canna indica]